jgi:hypothetical protein
MIRHHTHNSPITWEGHHVKGNQDEKKYTDDLDDWEVANILAHKDAKEERQLDRERSDESILEGAPWRLLHNGEVISGNIESTLRELFTKEKIQQRWKTTFGLSDEQAQSTSWEVFEKSHKLMLYSMEECMDGKIQCQNRISTH